MQRSFSLPTSVCKFRHLYASLGISSTREMPGRGALKMPDGEDQGGDIMFIAGHTAG